MSKYFRVVGQWLIVINSVFIAACSLSDSEAPSKKTISVRIEIETPDAIKNSKLDLLKIHGILKVESNNFLERKPFVFNNKQIDSIVMNLVEDSYTFDVEFSIHEQLYPGCASLQLLNSVSLQRTPNVDGNNLILFAQNHNYNTFDNDGDLISNLDEIDYLFNPCDANNTPVINPIRVRHNTLSFGNPAVNQGMTISWQPAVHKIKGVNLEYLWVSSPTPSITDVSSIDAAINNKAPTGNWSTAISDTVTNVNSAYNKYWNVMVRDNEGTFNVYAQAKPNGLGILDTSFSDNANGILSLNTSLSKPDGSQGLDMAVDNRRNYFIAGREYFASGRSTISVWSYDQLGNAIDTFGKGLGVAVLPNPLGVSSDDAANAIVLDISNNIIITGQVGSNNSLLGHNMILWKLFSSGIADTSFGDNNGYVMFDGIKGLNTDFSIIGNAITIDNNNNILVAGFAEINSVKTVMVVWRYDSQGKPDVSFGNGKGYITHNGLGSDVGTPNSKANDITVDSNNNIYVTGYTTNASGDTETTLWKFDNSGLSDANFGNQSGFASSRIASATGLNDVGHALHIDDVNRIVITGISQSSANIQSMALWRYQSNGQLDTTFASGRGYLTKNVPTGNSTADIGRSIDIDSHNNIVIAGSFSNGANIDMSVWRFTSEGILDTRFGPSGGYVTQHNATLTNAQSNDIGNRLIINSNGNYLIAGESQDINNLANMTVWQYQ